MEHFVEVSPGVKLWTTISGEENQVVVMLCGGGPGCADYLEPLAEMMDDSTKVIRFEERGCGRSTEDYRCDVDTTVADLDAIRRYYKVSSWIIAGHSWGANLALAYALKHPERSLALMYISGNGVQNDRLWSEEYHKNQTEIGERLPEIPCASNVEVNRLPYQNWAEGQSWRKGETYIVLVQTEQGFVEAGYHRKRTGLNHVAFHARSRHQVDELTTLLRDKGVLILYEDRHPHAGGPDHYAVFFEDPNRIKVEVVAP